ncbi:hypothetical protein FHG87_002250 [Trinorchestia longiramus]|nr:hypothetical protein FHG87_002250 [Trinorchestia longiramus]
MAASAPQWQPQLQSDSFSPTVAASAPSGSLSPTVAASAPEWLPQPQKATFRRPHQQSLQASSKANFGALLNELELDALHLISCTSLPKSFLNRTRPAYFITSSSSRRCGGGRRTGRSFSLPLSKGAAAVVGDFGVVGVGPATTGDGGKVGGGVGAVPVPAVVGGGAGVVGGGARAVGGGAGVVGGGARAVGGGAGVVGGGAGAVGGGAGAVGVRSISRDLICRQRGAQTALGATPSSC